MAKRVPETPTHSPTSTHGRQAMGTSAFSPIDAPSAKDVRAGFVTARPTKGSGSPILGKGPARQNVSAKDTLGAHYAVQAKRAAYTETYSGTLSAGRIVPPNGTMSDTFRKSGSSYGPLGPR